MVTERFNNKSLVNGLNDLKTNVIITNLINFDGYRYTGGEYTPINGGTTNFIYIAGTTLYYLTNNTYTATIVVNFYYSV